MWPCLTGVDGFHPPTLGCLLKVVCPYWGEAVQKIREHEGRHSLSELLLWVRGGGLISAKSLSSLEKSATTFTPLTEFSLFLLILVQVIWQWPQLGNVENGGSGF